MIAMPTVRGCVLYIYIYILMVILFDSDWLWQCSKFNSPLTFSAIWYVTQEHEMLINTRGSKFQLLQDIVITLL